MGGTLFFRANDGTSGFELWKSDGTANGTSLVKDINNGASTSWPNMLTNVENNGAPWQMSQADRLKWAE